jgi:hypothetical protein
MLPIAIGQELSSFKELHLSDQRKTREMSELLQHRSLALSMSQLGLLALVFQNS